MPTSDPPADLSSGPGRELPETKVFQFRGSMVARLKLKGIDGRAPPGVELAA